MRLFHNASYDFMGPHRKFFALSGALTVLVIAMSLFWHFNRGSWLNYGVDFTGGTLIQVTFQNATSEHELRPVVEGVIPGTEVTRFGAANEFMIRAPRFSSDQSNNTADAVVSAMHQKFGNTFTVERTEAVGPKVGNELQKKAGLAILLSFIATLIYLAFRMELRFGIAAIIATFHDITLTLGLISGAQLDVSLPTVAAVLTIVGYSLNDTIIIFDRIKENVKKSGRRESYVSLLNRSINETLPRTILTVSTTLLTLVALFLFTTGPIRQFALILITGIVLGTYSSIFIASPALLEIERRWPRKQETGKRTRAPRTAQVGV